MQAYELCMRKGLLKEQAFILGRMGNTKQALAVIINELGDMEEVNSHHQILQLVCVGACHLVCLVFCLDIVGGE